MTEKICGPAANATRKIVVHSVLISLLLGTVSPLLAADGWYLLIPPRSKYNEKAEYLSAYKILENKPMSQWYQQGAYDSAAECEDVKHTQLMVEQNTYSQSSENYMNAVNAGESKVILGFQRSMVEAWNANVLAFMASRCIKSNDPRLKP